jgi:hypothetical protein
MHTIDSAHANRFARHPAHWAHEADGVSAPSRANRNRSQDATPADTPVRGNNFVSQAIYSHVVNSLQATYRIAPVVPVQGQTPTDGLNQGLASAASQAVAPGGQGADSLRTSVNGSLSDASSQLQAIGVNPDDINTVVNDLRGRLESFLQAAGSAQTGSSSSDAVAGIGASVTQKQRTEVQVVTQEGDIVQLKLRTRVTAAAGAVASSTADGTISSAAGLVVFGGRFEISVHGNLNSDEIAAIQDVLSKIDSLSQDFFSGDIQGAFAAAANLNVDGSQLASVAVDLRSKQVVRGYGFSSLPAAATQPAETPATPTTQDTTPANPPVVASEDPAPAQDTSSTAPPAAPDQTTTTAPTTTDSTQSDSAPPAMSLVAFLTHWLNSLGDTGNSNSVSDVSVSWKSRLEVLLSSVTVHDGGNADPSSTPTVAQAGEAVNATA